MEHHLAVESPAARSSGSSVSGSATVDVAAADVADTLSGDIEPTDTGSVGAGSADRVSKVRWTVARDIAIAWVLTIPVSALLAASLYLIVDLIL